MTAIHGRPGFDIPVRAMCVQTPDHGISDVRCSGPTAAIARSAGFVVDTAATLQQSEDGPNEHHTCGQGSAWLMNTRAPVRTTFVPRTKTNPAPVSRRELAHLVFILPLIWVPGCRHALSPES